MNPFSTPLLEAAESAYLLSLGAGLAGGPGARREALKGRIGEQTARRTGSGLDYAETRLYQNGDEPRRVHWRATARSGKMQVRCYHQEISPLFCCVVDRRAAMRFGTRRRLKAAQAARLALVLAARAAARGAEISALILGQHRHWLPATGGTAGLRRLAARLTQPCPPLQSDARENSLREALDEVSRRLASGAEIALISDFHDRQNLQNGALRQLAARFEVTAYAVYDRAEQALPDAGELLLCWNNNTLSVNEGSTALRKKQRCIHQEYREQLHEACRQAGIPLHFAAADNDKLVDILNGIESNA